MTNDELKKIEETINNLISDLEIPVTIKAAFDEKENNINVQIDSDQAAALIGFHGETLLALQLVSSFLVHKILGDWTKVIVNVGDYRQKREEQLKRLALNLAMKVKFSGEAQIVPNLSPAERRLVHMALADHPDVVSESEGEGRERTLVIKPKITG